MGKQSIQWLYLNNSTRARIAKLQALEFVAFPNSAKVFPCFLDPPPTFSNFFLHALPKSISEKLLLTSFQSRFSFLSASLHVSTRFHCSSAPYSEMSLSLTTTMARWWCPWPCATVSLWRSQPPTPPWCRQLSWGDMKIPLGPRAVYNDICWFGW